MNSPDGKTGGGEGETKLTQNVTLISRGEGGKKKTDIIRIPSKRSIDNPLLSRNDSLVNAVSKADEMRVELSRCEHRHARLKHRSRRRHERGSKDRITERTQV